jgi:hypothetical protein
MDRCLARGNDPRWWLGRIVALVLEEGKQGLPHQRVTLPARQPPPGRLQDRDSVFTVNLAGSRKQADPYSAIASIIHTRFCHPERSRNRNVKCRSRVSPPTDSGRVRHPAILSHLVLLGKHQWLRLYVGTKPSQPPAGRTDPLHCTETVRILQRLVEIPHPRYMR